MYFGRLKRREFIALLGGAVGWPLAARAQQADRIRRVGALMSFFATDPAGPPRANALQQEMQRLGWVEGRNIQFNYRWTGSDPELMRKFAVELAQSRPDVLFANGPAVLAALQRETRTLPIVFAVVDDPVGSGFVTSIAHPGGNITGFSSSEFSLGGKWLELLKGIAPHVTNVGVFFNPTTAPYADIYVRSVEAAAAFFGVTVTTAHVRDTSDFEQVVRAYAGNGALIVPPDTFTVANRSGIIAAAAEYKVPVVYPFRYFALEGGLMVYGINSLDLYRRAAAYVDSILRGAVPGDLPVQQPTKYEFLINLRTAKALSLSVPDKFLATADQVVE